MARRSVAGWALLTVAFTGMSASCSAPTSVEWSFTRVQLPSGVQPVTLAVIDDRLLVAGRDATSAPTVHLVHGGVTTAVPVTAVSGYGREATWTSVVTSGGAIAAVGGARGGAHSNVRWSVWSGDARGLAEQEQTFETFGGWGAGELLGVVAAPGGEFGAIGSWAGSAGGEDIAVWRRDGARYVRLPSEGSPLASTPRELVGSSVALGVPDGVVIGGNVTELGTDIRVRPALWQAPALTGPWTRMDLPTGARITRADAVSCRTRSQCMVLGTAGDVLAGWQSNGGDVRRLDVPELPAATYRSIAVVPDADGALGLAVSDGSLRLFRLGTRRAAIGPPTADIRAAVRLRDAVYVVVLEPSGTPTLLRATPG